MMSKGRFCAGVAGMILASACAPSVSPLVRQQCYDPDARLAAVLKPLEARQAQGCPSTADCEALKREVERLALVCPGHVPTLMANAVLAYDGRRREIAQPYLDGILAMAPVQPDAAVLRARIAIEDGNLSFARRLLTQQIRLSPAHAGLHEAYGAVLYLDRQWADAIRELTAAQELGAPLWRVSYHLGLVAEAQGQIDEARRRYTDALEANPGWPIAQARLTGLGLPPATVIR